MFKVLFLLILMLPCALYAAASDIEIAINNNQGVLDVEDEDDQPGYQDSQLNQIDSSNRRLSGSTRQLAHEFAQICYGKPCKSNKFLIEPCENLLKTLKKTDNQQYLRYATIIKAQTDKRTQQTRNREIAQPTTGNVPIEFVQLAIQSWKNDHALKSDTISQQDESLNQLEKYGTYKTRGIAGSIAIIVLQMVGYLVYTFVSQGSC